MAAAGAARVIENNSNQIRQISRGKEGGAMSWKQGIGGENDLLDPLKTKKERNCTPQAICQ